MITLIGGPPRVGKSTLTVMLLERDGLPYCPTDALVSMLEHAAPQLGVRHGEHDEKAARMQPFLLEFLRAVNDGIDPDDPSDGFVVEGDAVIPHTVAAASELGLPIASVFLLNSSIRSDDLRYDMQWLHGASDKVLENTAEWIRGRSLLLRDACDRQGEQYVDVGEYAYPEGIEMAYRLLRQKLQLD